MIHLRIPYADNAMQDYWTFADQKGAYLRVHRQEMSRAGSYRTISRQAQLRSGHAQVFR